MTPLLVALAGGLGAVARFVLDHQVTVRTPNARLPLGTTIINVTGSFLLGLIVGWWAFHGGDPGLKQVVGTGFLGGYTTFSAASVETLRLARGGRWWPMALHAGSMLVLSVAAAAVGFWLGAM